MILQEKLVMKTLSRLVLSILCIQLVLGGQPKAYAQASAVNVTTRSLTKGYAVQPEGDEKNIDTVIEAERYVSSTIRQNEVFKQQCLDETGEIDPKAAFVLSDNIPYSDMQVLNCGMEAEKLQHMNQFAAELVKEYPVQSQNENCAECSIPGNAKFGLTEDGNQMCSLDDQARLAKQPCNFYCMMKPAITASTMGMGTLIASAFTGGNDGCSKSSTFSDLGKGMSCMGNVVKGIIKGIWEAISGLAKLAWEGIKAAGRAIAKGAKAVWGWFTGTEDKSAEKAHAISQMDQKNVDEYQKDQGGWFKRQFNKVLDFLKELTYVGLFERESKCMNCAEKGQLMCEIGGRVISDVVGFTFTLGAGYGALKTAVTKLGPKLAGIVPKVSLRAFSTGGRASKIMGGIGSKAKWIGNATVNASKPIGQAVVKKWNAFKNSAFYLKLMKPKGALLKDLASRAGKNIKIASKAIGDSVPAKVVIQSGRVVKKGVMNYLEFDSKVFAKGFGSSATFLANNGIGMTKMQIAREVSKLSKLASASKDGLIIDKQGNKVMRLPVDQLTSENIAQLNRAGALIKESADGSELVVRIKPKALEEMKIGKFATEFDPILGVPKDKNGVVVIKQGNSVLEKNVSELTANEVNKLRDEGAVFTTLDHPNAQLPLDPNEITSKTGVKVGRQGEIVLKTPEGKVMVVNASEVTPKQIKAWQKQDYQFTVKEPGNQWERPINASGELEGSAINHSASAQLHDLRVNGKGEEASQIALDEVNRLNVIKESGEISGASIAAKNQLSKSKGIHPSHFEGIEGSVPVETVFDGEKNLLRFEAENGVAQQVPCKGGNCVVETYQDGKRAIVKNLETGKSEIYDFTANRIKTGENQVLVGKKVASIPKKDAAVLDEAMAKTVNGKPSNVAAIEEVETNLKLNKESGYTVKTEANGEKHIEIETGKGCKPGKIDVTGSAI